jgi:hypothetical protein
MNAWRRSGPIEFGDPVLAHCALPLQQTFYPLGFPVSIKTNSDDVLEAANEQWSAFRELFPSEPIRLEVLVTTADTRLCPPTPLCRMHGAIMTNVADSENHIVTDFERRTATIWTTEAAVAHREYFRYFFLESAAMSLLSSGYATAIHAACVALDDQGVLLCGDSGAGKSTLSYACARAGWTYITDDGSYLVHKRDDLLVTGNCGLVRFRPSAEALFPELNGLPVVQRAGIGKPSVELSQKPSASWNASSTAWARHLVFIKRNVDEQELTAFPPAVARLYMQQRVHCLPYAAELHMNAIDRLLQCGIFELRYNDLDWAIARLTQLVREDR